MATSAVARMSPATKRPARGRPEETRARLLKAAAEVFNRDGYYGTDSNRLARAAGYAPGTFYKHFADKHAIFLAVYEAWIDEEWGAIGEALRQPPPGGARALAAQLVALTAELHRRWRGLRRSLRGLVVADPGVRAFYLAQRRRQLELLRDLRQASGRPARPAADDAVFLYTLERVSDALAEDELSALGVPEGELLRRLEALVEAHLTGAP
jgi:AcrR family transcriptional regulator